MAAIPDGNIRFSENEIIKVEKHIETIEPTNYFNNFNDFPLLILNGKMDKLIPIMMQETLIQNYKAVMIIST